DHAWAIRQGVIPMIAWIIFLWHALLLSLLIVTSLTDMEHMEIPLTVTITGTAIGLLGATLLAWPFPSGKELAPLVPIKRNLPVPLANQPTPQPGLYSWPVWHPLPVNLPERSWQLGLLTGLAGAAAGAIMLRGVRFLFALGRGIEGLGVGDADLMMMAGSFIGWQPALIAFMAGVFPALIFGIIQVARGGRQMMPFGPSLAIGVLIALLGWPWIGPRIWPFFSDIQIMVMLTIIGSVGLLATAFALRLIRGTATAGT
ncbi:MAG: prepilin peptidase, partial [Candidatus Acidiferrum sp.]